MCEINKIVRQFLDNQKIDFLTRKVEQETRDKRKNYAQLLQKIKDTEFNNELLLQAKNKLDEATIKAESKFKPEAEIKYDLNEWFAKIVSQVKPNVTSHPAKFTNPKIKDVSTFLFYGESQNDGYLKTGNVDLDVKIDVSGNSATNTLIFEFYHLLNTNLSNGNRLINYFESDSAQLIEFINKIGIDYKKMKDLSLDVFYGVGNQQSTHELIKQIYFPISNENYHLLSLVTPSMILFEMKNRIDDFNILFEGRPIKALKKDNKFHSEGFDEILGLTQIGFSHTEFTKMGNVSYLNVRNEGLAYLLPSCPPVLTRRKVRLPTTNFFKNSLYAKSFQDAFQSLDKLIKADINNLAIRQGIQNNLKYIIEQVLHQVFTVRQYPLGWSKSDYYQSLPHAQRIWLDDIYEEQRENQADWLDEIVREFANWILDTYEYLCKDTVTKLSDFELREVRQIVKQVIQKDQEFLK